MPSSFTVKGKGLKEIAKRAASAKGSVKVGIQGSEASAAHGEGEPITNVQIAAIHEFNGPQDKPPGRPFIRPIYDNDPQAWKLKIAEAMKRVIIEGGNPKSALRRIGEEYRRKIIELIKSHIPPPLALSTLMARNARKGGHGGKSGYQARAEKEERTGKPAVDDTPLIDTGTLIGAISVEVVDE